MDPVAHTLVGAALAQTGLRRTTPYAAGALLIGANLPDIDAVAQFWGGDVSLCVRRGWTHGVLAMALLPSALAGILLLAHRLRRPRQPPPAFGRLAALAYLATLTHPALDWLNNYGVRLLMPFDGAWFYGDTLFIVDPWMWLALGGAVFLGWPRTRPAVVLWIGAFAAATALFFLAVDGMRPAKLLWLAALAVLGWAKLRRAGAGEARSRLLAKAGLALAAAYIAFMLAASRYARSAVAQDLAGQGIRSEGLMVGPVPVMPFRKEVVASTPEGYRYGEFRFFGRPRLRLAERFLPRPDHSPVVRQALHSPEVRGFMNWARFPFAEIEKRGRRYDVYIMDARFARRRESGFGSTKVTIPAPQ